jgi:hypothetical protein
MVNRPDQARHNRYFCAADALFLFITPVTLRKLQQPLRARLENDVADQSLLVTQTMFTNIASTVAEVRGLPADAPLKDVSAALLLTKADQLLSMEGFDATLLEELPHDQLGLTGVRQRLAAETSKVKHFIERQGGLNLVLILRTRFPYLTYHAVSATGSNADDSGHFPVVRPARVVEPLLEVLAQHGLVTDAVST